jgi:hypothetical protein
VEDFEFCILGCVPWMEKEDFKITNIQPACNQTVSNGNAEHHTSLTMNKSACSEVYDNAESTAHGQLDTYLAVIFSVRITQ